MTHHRDRSDDDLLRRFRGGNETAAASHERYRVRLSPQHAHLLTRVGVMGDVEGDQRPRLGSDGMQPLRLAPKPRSSICRSR